jgi:hypothetical protein
MYVLAVDQYHTYVCMYGTDGLNVWCVVELWDPAVMLVHHTLKVEPVGNSGTPLWESSK